MTDIREVLSKLDPDYSKEAYEFLSSIDPADYSDYDLATAIAACDRTKPMPRVIFNYLYALYMKAINDGNADAMNDLGALYYDGRGCEQDFTKAVQYYHMAAMRGNRIAQENLGYCYYYGRNVPVDYEKAFQYFSLGAFVGSLTSLYKIGDMYQNGYYVEKNPEEAFRIYNRCLEQMTDEAAPTVAGPVYLRMGNAFLYGNGTKEDPKGALACFQRAELFLYDMVANGDGMYKKSLEAAIKGQETARQVLQEAISR